ncbi:WXG100 family type VII secretion target [Streptacidiphilus jiangxiensis]|uniref:WXG100 family type VII secretion target n=1 Tax=Streptacidiphilus jiangxiensis TaxID=235985 RepID=A0A1H7XT34_STRJI|nr:WXG100 family type VII secretion target [Streptacidiphilus jiangxiensis]SEM37036.1 WXG100 family type VII secretion target [Streptacidiphilus jiangxiensis]
MYDINGAIADKVAKVLSLLNLPWPGGDPATLRDFAGEWRAMAGELTRTADQLDSRVGQVVGTHWQGAAADAFEAHWRLQHQAMQQSSQNFEAVAKELESYADEAEQIIAAIVEIALQIAEFELAGALLTVFTAGISDAVAAAASGERAWKITQLIDKFIKLGEKAIKVITELINEIRKMGAIPRIIMDALKNTAMNLIGTQLTNVMTGQGWIKGSDVKTAALAGSLGSVGGSALDGLGEKFGGSGGLGKIGNFLSGKGADGEPLTGAAAFGSRAFGGGLTSGAAAVGTDIYQGKDAGTTVADGVTSTVTGGVGAGVAGGHQVDALPSQGRHAKPVGPYTPITTDLGANGYVYGAGGAVETDINATKLTPQQQGADGAVEVVP